MGGIVVRIEGEPCDVAEFIKNFQPTRINYLAPGEGYLTKEGQQDAPQNEGVVETRACEEPPHETYSKGMVMQALKHYGMRIQQRMGVAETSPYVKGLIHSVVGDSYTGWFDSVGEEYYYELYTKAQEDELYGEWS